jgi:hypothetical protein
MATELDKLVVKIEADLSDLKKKMAQADKVVGNSSKKMSGGLLKLNQTLNRVAISMAKIGTVAGIAFGALAIRSVIKTGMEIQRLEIRFNNLFGSVEEGNRAFKQLLEYAGTVPFSLGEIQAGSGSLAVVSKDAEHLRDIMEITGNVAVIAGLDFRTAASQIQRVFSGGLAAADIFREKGVSQIIKDTGMMVDTVEGAAKAFEAVFAGNGKFANATKEMAVTVEGNISMIGDVLQQFTIAVAEGFFVKLAGGLEDFRAMLDSNKGEIKRFGKEIGESLGTAFENIGLAIDGMVVAFKLFISLKVGIFLTTLTAKVTTLKRAMLALNLAIKANPIFFAVSVIASVVLLKDELKALGSMITNFIIDKFIQAKVAYENFINSFISQEAKFARLGKELSNATGMSGVARADLLFGKDRKSAQDRINSGEIEALRKEKKITELTLEQYQMRAQMVKVQMDRIAKIEGEAFDKKQLQLKEVQDSFKKIGDEVAKALGKAVVSGRDFKDNMVDIFRSVLQQVAELIIQLYVIKPLLDSINARFGIQPSNIGTASATSTAIANSSGVPTGSMIFGGDKFLNSARASGGSVNANMPYMVGERGAEMFVPKSAGNIINNNRLGGMGGGQPIVIEQNLNFATGVSQTVRAEVLNLLPAIQESTMGAIQDARLRGGRFAKDFGA